MIREIMDAWLEYFDFVLAFWFYFGVSSLAFCLAFGFDCDGWFCMIYVLVIMEVMRFHFLFVGLSGCHDGGGNSLTKTSLITHLCEHHFNGNVHAITKYYLAYNLDIFEVEDLMFKCMGLWLCEVCFKTHNLRSKFRHDKGPDFVQRPNYGDGVFRFVLYDLTKPQVPSFYIQLDHVGNLMLDEHDGFTSPLFDSLVSKGLRTINFIHPKCRLGFFRVLKGALNKNVKKCKRHIRNGYYTATIRILSSSGVAPYNDAILEDLNVKHPFKPTPSLPHIHIDHHQLSASPDVLLDTVKSFPLGKSCRRDGLLVNKFHDGKCSKVFCEYIASAPFTLLVKLGGGIHLRVLGTAWRRLVSKVSADMIGNSFDGYLNDLQFGVGVSGKGRIYFMSGNVDFNYSRELVMKRAAKTIKLMDAVAKIDDPQCELLLLWACVGISKLYFTMRTCSPCVFERAQRSFDTALRSALECILIARIIVAGENIDNATMEQYLTLTRRNQEPGVVRPEIRDNVNFEIKSQFMRELREDTFSGNKNDDAHKHIEQVLDIVIFFNILGVTLDVAMLRVFPITLTGAAKKWVDKLTP
nr:putative reverse transcriptase domain-containing protein [Tanacetum cinerariifolium]